MKSQEISKAIKMYPLGIMDICAKIPSLQSVQYLLNHLTQEVVNQ